MSELDDQQQPTMTERDLAFKAAVDELKTEKEDTEQAEQGQATAEAAALDSAALCGLVDFGLSFGETIIQGATQLPEFKFDAEKRQNFITSTQPVVDKYGLTWLSWFEAYQAEIMMGIATITLFGSSYAQVKALQTEKEETQLLKMAAYREMAAKEQHAAQLEQGANHAT